jgi:HEAT repeat protein
LQAIMKDRKSGAAAKAALVAALATDPDQRTTRVLVKVAADKNWVLRMAALEALSVRGDASVLPQIEPGLNDTRHEVQEIAAATVIHLSDVAHAHNGLQKTALLGATDFENDDQGVK